MKTHYLTLLFAAFSVLISCKSDSAKTAEETAIEESSPITATSAYYNKIVYKHQGAYLGLNLGNSRTEVMAAMDGQTIEEESDSYVYYNWVFDNNESYLDLYFDENNKLNYINGFVYFYDETDNYNREEAQKFYNDMVADFTTKYGEPIITEKNSLVFANWISKEVEAEVGLDAGEVNWAIFEHIEALEQ